MKGIILLLNILTLVFIVVVSINGQRTALSSLSFLDEMEDHGQAKRSGLASFYKAWTVRPGRRFRYMRMTDAGYGSRIIVASGLVRALIGITLIITSVIHLQNLSTRHNIYGMFGPGRKK